MAYGWLAKNPDLPPKVLGVSFDRDLPTRREEYHLVAKVLEKVSNFAGLILDAGTGYIPNWHVAPYIAAALGFSTFAVDTNPLHMEMPPHPKVLRSVQSMTKIAVDKRAFDAILSISVIEHCPDEVRAAFAKEAARLAKPGAVLLVTADEFDPELLVSTFPEFDFGTRTSDPTTHLSPRVAYAYGTRR